jgi:hypothetical protein
MRRDFLSWLELDLRILLAWVLGFESGCDVIYGLSESEFLKGWCSAGSIVFFS